jgi:hypothetical protein
MVLLSRSARSGLIVGQKGAAQRPLASHLRPKGGSAMRGCSVATLVTAVALVGAIPTVADTIVGGPITEDTTWSADQSPYIVQESVVVRNDATLTIEPGVEVRFDQGMELQVGCDDLQEHGTLVAIGESPDQLILFTSNLDPQDPNDWNGIEFVTYAYDAVYDENGAYDHGCTLQAVVIEYAGGDDGAVDCEWCAPYLYDVTVQNTSSSGIYAETAAGNTPALRVVACCVTGCDSTGIYVWGGAEHYIAANDIVECNASGSAGGLYVGHADDCEVKWNHVRYNEATK